jgi:hypothetical protein
MTRKLPDQARNILRAKHYSCRTEQSSIDWMRRCILFRTSGRIGSTIRRCAASRLSGFAHSPVFRSYLKKQNEHD